MIKRFVVFTCLVVFAAILWVEKPLSVSAGGDWLPINPADLAMKDNPASPGADAMILYHESIVSLKEVYTRGDSDEEYERIKIFTDAGKDYANVEIPYVAGDPNDYSNWDNTSGGTQIIGIRGRTIHPDGSITNFDGKVYNKVVVRAGGFKAKAATFTLPDVQPGCIIEYKYTKQGEPGWLHDEEWTVSKEIFTREAHFTFIPPTEYTGFAPYYRIHGLSKDAIPKCDVGVDRACVMTAKDVPAVINEPLMPPRRAIEGRVDWYFEEGGQPASESPERFWARKGKKWDQEMEHFVDKKGALAQEVSKTVSASDSPEVKLQKLYARAQQIRNLSYEDQKSSQELKAEDVKKVANVEAVLKDGYGTGQQINFLFVGLARAAGFDATELRVTPRNHDLFTPATEDEEQVGADVVWVKAGDKEYYLDPASRYSPFGLLPWFETETSGVRLTKDGATMAQTPALHSTDATLVRHADLKIGPDGSIEGKVQLDFTGEEAIDLRRDMYKEDETGRKKDIADRVKGWLPSGTSFEISNIANWDNIEKPVHVEGTLKLVGTGSVVGHRILLPEDFFLSPDAQDFKAQKRINAVYFPYPYEENDDLTFHAPAGFKIEVMPKSQGVNAGAVTYDISATANGDSVEAKRHLVVKGVAFPNSAYPGLRNFYSITRTYDGDQIVFENDESAKSN